MFEPIMPAGSQPRQNRRPRRLIWTATIFTAAAVSLSAGAVDALTDDESATVTTTPVDPCLLDNTCNERQGLGEDQPWKSDLQERCDALKVLGQYPPECVALGP